MFGLELKFTNLNIFIINNKKSKSTVQSKPTLE